MDPVADDLHINILIHKPAAHHSELQMMHRSHDIAEMSQMLHACGAIRFKAFIIGAAVSAGRHDSAFGKRFRKRKTAGQFRRKGDLFYR